MARTTSPRSVGIGEHDRTRDFNATWDVTVRSKGGTCGKGVMCDKGTSRRECERKRKKQSAKKEEEKRKNIPSGCGKRPLRVAWECTYLSEKAGGA